MSAKWQRIKIDIPDEYGPQERAAIAVEIVDFIVQRTQGKSLDKNNRPLPKYSESYVKSLDFKIAGKSKSRVDLTLSGDMLGALDLLNHRRGQIVIGYENGSEENAKADGNIRGAYGKKPGTGPARDFLGIHPDDLEAILEKYPIEDKESRLSRVDIVLNQED